MRHGKKVNHLGRKKGHRTALLKNMSCSLIEHKRINTTLAKAKALRVHLEPLITKAKTNTTHSRRVVFSYLQSKEATAELFGTVAEKVGSRPGGYLRIIKTGFRKGDGAETAMIEFVDFNDVYASSKTAKKSGSRRRRGKKSGAKATEAAAVTAVAQETTTKATEAKEIISDSKSEEE